MFVSNIHFFFRKKKLDFYNLLSTQSHVYRPPCHFFSIYNLLSTLQTHRPPCHFYNLLSTQAHVYRPPCHFFNIYNLLKQITLVSNANFTKPYICSESKTNIDCPPHIYYPPKTTIPYKTL